jgi:hypothetical protein
MDYNSKKRTHKKTDIIIHILYNRYLLMRLHLSLHAVSGLYKGGGGQADLSFSVILVSMNAERSSDIDRGKRYGSPGYRNLL